MAVPRKRSARWKSGWRSAQTGLLPGADCHLDVQQKGSPPPAALNLVAAMNMNIKVPTGASHGLTKSLIRKLGKIGVDLPKALDGDIPALSAAIHAVGRAENALNKKPPAAHVPSSERGGKGQTVVACDVVDDAHGKVQAHRVVWPIDEIAKHLTAEELAAAERFRACYETMHRSQGVANYTGAGGGSSAKDAITERQVAAGAHYRRMLAELGSDASKGIAANFVLEHKAPGADRVMSFAEFGAGLVGGTDPIRHRYAAYGALKAVCDRLAYASRRLDVEGQEARRASARSKIQREERQAAKS